VVSAAGVLGLCANEGSLNNREIPDCAILFGLV